ncbi:SGNH/GDSL hydrolase family protein [Bacillus suaedaesalsae]|uniref:SGNH/GDSL hydrolase family protein n=1 Tax=Bacillus suaedaesalsae TaxID=2810349 RepID=A0ABS2DFP0_9BACI|nr:SGNH/GDSL hydrolase family protein [Bacillus suaedaesalsae]MBM6617236.1 SGNH/GDSL hydrolase family protein [Bacillus suaedaesalsae]
MKNYILPVSIVISIFSFFFLLIGFGWTLNTHFFGQKQEIAVNTPDRVETENENEEKDIVALGDSLTRGTGDADGKGYIGYLVEQLQEKTNEEITIHNLGITGYRSNQLLDLVKKQEVQRQVGQADIVVITIGGNDLFQSGQTLLSLDLEKVDQIRIEYLQNLEQIITNLRETNENATIYLVGLYNPFIDLADAEVTTDVVRQWNFDTSKLLDQYPNTVFVPTFDLFQLKVNDYLYSDKFHPNTEGYRLIAERVASLITW